MQGLSFPSYLPDKKNLRAYLLVYDKLWTIVPGIDQPKVENRAEAEEVRSVLEPDVLGFFDPTFEYSEWFNQASAQDEFRKLAEKAELSAGAGQVSR